MKKLLLSVFSVAIAFSAFGQNREAQGTYEMAAPAAPQQLNKVMVVEDTLFQPVFGANCDPSLYTFTSGGSPISGTFNLGNGLFISDVAQLLNLSSRDVEVEALLIFTNAKTEGPSKASFVAEIYDTLGGPSPLRPDYTAEAVSQSISFDNIDTAMQGINRFSFSTPFSTTEPFWASLKVENGSDTVSVFTTSDDCGGQQPTAIMNINDTLWTYYASVFSSAGDPLDFALWMWAEVDTADQGIGLPAHYISKAGLDFYPNPATDQATIEFHLPSESNLTLVVQDMSGREVLRTSKTFGSANRKFEISLDGFEAGPYTYQVIGEKRQLNGLFVKK